MITNKILIHNPVHITGDTYRLNIYFKNQDKAKYLNINDNIKDVNNSVYKIINTLLPFQDGDEVTVNSINNNVLPVENVDYDSIIYTPNQKDFNQEIKTYGNISFVDIYNSTNYEYNILANWEGSYIENQIILGDRFVDENGKEFIISYIDSIQRFNVVFRAIETNKTGQLPTIGRATLYKATNNYNLYQGTNLKHSSREIIRNRDNAIIDDVLNKLDEKIDQHGYKWKGDWSLNVEYSNSDLVTYDNNVYVYIYDEPSVNVPTSNSAYWDLFIAGTNNDKNYVYEQLIADNVWNISHSLNKFPSVTIVDSGGNEVIGEIEYINQNQCMITFSSPFTGKAFLN